MLSYIRHMAGLVVLFIITSPAHAHFIFVSIGPFAEGGRFAEVYFSAEAEAGDPHFVEKIKHTQLWFQTKPGKFQPLEVHPATDRLRAMLPGGKAHSVVGFCQYGVVRRNVPFLLRYYPKAVSGSPDVLNHLKPFPKIAFEITATFEQQQISFRALRNGKPVKTTTFFTIDSNLQNEQLFTDPSGETTWTPPGAGRYSIYTSQVLPQSGESGGKHYTEIREFATLAFHWPMVDESSDNEAVTLFEEAIQARAQWNEFPGFRADITTIINEDTFHGSTTVSASGSTQSDMGASRAESWVNSQLQSIALHRGARDTNNSTPVRLRFADQDKEHPLGRLLTVSGGQFASSYRIRDKQILIVNRALARQNLTIRVLANELNTEGRFLPHVYTVQYWDHLTGATSRCETVQNRWKRVGNWDLPTDQIVTVATHEGLETRQFTLKHHELLSP